MLENFASKSSFKEPLDAVAPPDEFARYRATHKLEAALGALHQFGTTEDVEAASNAVAKIAATAMRRRPAK